jgi:hypothetical protein
MATGVEYPDGVDSGEIDDHAKPSCTSRLRRRGSKGPEKIKLKIITKEEYNMSGTDQSRLDGPILCINYPSENSPSAINIREPIIHDT